MSEEDQDRYVAQRDAGHEANTSRCEGRKDDAVAIGADANRRLEEMAPPPRRRWWRWNLRD